MKINAFYDQNLEIIKILCVLKTPHKRITTNFVFDTGSAHTILNYTDSRREVPLAKKSKLIRMGGEVYQSYELNKIEILFKTSDNNIANLSFPVKIIKPNSFSIEKIENLDRFPNILGLDFLNKGYQFFCDIQRKEIFFNKN